MSAKPPPKPEENLKDKFMGLFRRSRPAAPLNVPKPAPKDFVITPQILKDIGPESPANNRMRSIKDLCDTVKQMKLEEYAAEALWVAISDLVQPQIDSEIRHQALKFLLCLIEGQLKYLGMMRGSFFHVIDCLDIQEDLEWRLKLFRVLSDDGKNLLDFEEETGPFLLKVMPDTLAANQMHLFLPMLINVIKFNAAYIDEDIMSGLVQQTCMIQNRTRSEDDMKLCNQVVDTVICYSFLPADALQYVVAGLCHMVNKPHFCESSWELMRKLMGTHLGHKTIFTLCCLMQDKQQPVDFVMLRGAVFFTGMALWGSRRIACLTHSPSSVLPSFYQALSFGNPLIAHEVGLNIQRLVTKYGKDLTHETWDLVFNILEALLNQAQTVPDMDPRVNAMVHDILTDIETLQQRGQLLGDKDKIFMIVQKCFNDRPIDSVCKLIDRQARDIHPGKPMWIQNLHQLLDKFFKNETRTEIRKKALGVFSFILDLNKHVYEAEMIDKLVIPVFMHIDNDPDIEVRKMAIDIIMGMAQGCSSHEFSDLISIVEKITRKPLFVRLSKQPSSEEEGSGQSEDRNLDDVRLAMMKILEVFQHKLYTSPPSHCERLYELIIGHMQAQYTKEYNTSSAANIRKAIMELLLQLRSDGKHRVGLVNRRGITGTNFSAYVLCTQSEIEIPTSPVAGTLSINSLFACIDYTHVLELFITCLKKEVDWPVKITVLQGLPLVLENKTLVFSTRGNLVYTLCVQLCSMLSNPTIYSKMQRTPDGFRQATLHEAVLPVVAGLVSYHHVLDRARQIEMVKCLEFGLITGVAKVCVTSLRICSLEMQELMVKVLPSVLLSLTKISATMSMAIPVLAFLSSVVRLPKLYANFTHDQYLSVFAIALPYTNPFRFSHYTVSLAHHVINIWYIRCRLPFRKSFARYIRRGFITNVDLAYEEKARELKSLQSKEASHAATSGADHEAAKKSKEEVLKADIEKLLSEDPKKQFHDELMESNLDLLSRYALGNLSNRHRRSAMTEFLLAGGQHATWIVGNKLITITTSGGKSGGSSGLCAKCNTLLQHSKDPNKAMHEKRRRHKSAILARSISEIDSNTPRLFSGHYRTLVDESHLETKDDIDVGFKHTQEDVGVQTGSSLSSSFDPETLGPILLNWKNQIEEKAVWATDPCPCWCAGWAEVIIRGPSGDVAWIMRTENMPTQYDVYNDPSIPDISLLFSPVVTASGRSPDTDSVGKLDSGSLKEEEYDTVHAEFFGWDNKSSGPSEGDRTDSSSQGHELQGDGEGSSVIEMGKSSSSPSFFSSPQDDLSPKEVIASLMVKSRSHDDEVKIRVDSSESRAMAAASNFEGLEKGRGAGEEKTERDQFSGRDRLGERDQGRSTDGVRLSGKVSAAIPVSAKDQRSLADSGRAAESLAEAARLVDDDLEIAEVATESDLEHTPKASLEDSQETMKKEQGRSSSKLQAQLREYDLQQKEEGRSGVSIGTLKSNITRSHTTKDDTVVQHESLRPLERPRCSTSPQSSLMAHRITTKHSPQQNPITSPGSSSSSSVPEELPELRTLKQRGHTISIMTPAEATRQHDDAEQRVGIAGKDAVGKVSPGQVFLQLYHTHPLLSDTKEAPILMESTKQNETSLRLLDNQLPYEAHKIGVIYVGPGQVRDEKAILGNRYGSGRYMEFVQGLGQMLSLKSVEQNPIYLGGLGPEDGKFTYIWQDESMLVIFHIATLMPNRKCDPKFNDKKMHIGNDFVTIVYNDSGEEFKLGTLSGQFNFVNIVIEPLDHGGNAVSLLAKQEYFEDLISKDIADILGHTHPKIISDTNLALLVRQIAVHCNMASFVLSNQKLGKEPFASNILERLRSIKRLKDRVQKDLQKKLRETAEQYGRVHTTGSEDPDTEPALKIQDFTYFV